MQPAKLSQSTPIPVNARDAACRVLSAHAGQFPDLMPIEPDTHHLQPRDRALAHAIIREGLVRWMTLRHIITQLAGRGFETMEPRMQAVLISGAAQLLLLDRLPPHAVINESVEWAKRYIRPKAGGMTNAILRKVARTRSEYNGTNNQSSCSIPLSNGEVLELSGITLPQDPLALASVIYSVPKASVRRWQEAYKNQTTDLLAHTLLNPPTILYTNDWSMIEDPGDLSAHVSNEHRVFTGSRTHLVRLLDSNPEVRVQDPASSAVVRSIPDGGYSTIVDYCAGQGTKTRQLTERFPNADIIALEINSQRLDTLMDVFADNPRVKVRHIDELPTSLENGADLILTDVPCSNSGVLARCMEARFRPMDAQITRLNRIQLEILSTVIPHIKPNGTLVYSTCSIEPDENQQIKDWIDTDPLFEFISQHQILPSAVPGDPASLYTDASYSCIFKKLK